MTSSTPLASAIGRMLIGGAALFGLGWGRAGLCPGPALALLGFGGWQPLLFVAAMLAGMGLFHLAGRPAPAPPAIIQGGP